MSSASRPGIAEVWLRVTSEKSSQRTLMVISGPGLFRFTLLKRVNLPSFLFYDQLRF
jgi:hypothetical protein